jgi:DNA repair photolyase
MNTKPFNGKAIYQPAAKAGEYAEYACNFYVGCSCNCAYCYNKTGRFKATLGGNVPTLKKCFNDECHALEIFEKELQANLPELQKHGLFFTFTSDFALSECYDLTMKAVDICVENEVPVKLLTKKVDWIDKFLNEIEYGK